MATLISRGNEEAISTYLRSPTHALLLVAPKGFGKSKVLRHICSQILEVSGESIDKDYRFWLIENPEGSIGIDEIREIKGFLKLKQSSKKDKRVVAVIDCQKMTLEAQNSLLKLLEEPPSNTHIIMSTSNTESILPTIKSRVQIIQLQPNSKDELIKHFVSLGHQVSDVERAYLMTGGLFDNMEKLLEGESEDSSFTLAKTIISSDAYQRLITVDGLSKDKQRASELLYALRRTTLAGLRTPTKNYKQTQKLHRALRAVNRCEEQIAKSNPNLKLLLGNLMLSM